MRIVIIGGVAAGASAAFKIKRINPAAQVAVYERGAFLSYGACGLPYYISGENADYGRLIARRPEDFRRAGIEVRLLCEAVSVDAAARQVTLRDRRTGEAFADHYDELIIAKGSAAVRPPIPGADAPGVFCVKSMEDALALREVAARPEVESVCVVGGGYTGVEMAEAFCRMGKQVTLVSAAERILGAFAPAFSDLARRELESHGIAVRLGERATAVECAGSQRAVITAQGRYPADIVLMAAGVRPATEILRGTGVRLAANGAVDVDVYMRSSVQGIWAAGDCACVYNRVLHENAYMPFGDVANKCGRIAGANMAGQQIAFPGALGSAGIKIFDMEMGRTGMSEGDAQRLGISYGVKRIRALDHPAYYPGATMLMLYLLYEKGSRRLLGAQVAGQKGAVLRADIFAVAISAGMSADELGMADLAYAPPFSGAWDAVHLAANAAK